MRPPVGHPFAKMLLLMAAALALTGCPQLLNDDFDVVAPSGGATHVDLPTNAGATDASGGASGTVPSYRRGLENVSGTSSGIGVAGAANSVWGNFDDGGASGASSERGAAVGGYSRRG